MATRFQKSANNVHEMRLSHPGIISSEDFNKHFDLHCYKPSPDLQPFIVHIWTQRRKQFPNPLYKAPIEIASGPNIYIFFTQESAFIQGVAMHKFDYNPLNSPVVAGVKFQPGGFYPFMQSSVSELATTRPITSVFSAANQTFRERLLVQQDEVIVRSIEDLLRGRQPKHHKNLDVIVDILRAIETEPRLRTVSATARAFNMNERSLQLLFQTYVGVGIKWIITRRRLLEAIHRVRGQQPLHLTEIAAELGYSSQSHFSRDFKKTTGLTPSEYLKSKSIQR